MTHEPECTWAGTDVQPNHFYKDECFECHIARAAYQRGREDAAKAVDEEAKRFSWIVRAQETEEDGDLNWRVMPVLYAYGAARGDGEQE